MWVSSSSLLSSSVMIFARSYRLPTAKSHLDSQLWVLGGCTTLFCFCFLFYFSSLLCLLSVFYVYLCIFCIFILFCVLNYCILHAWSGSRIVINWSFAYVCMTFVSSFVILLDDITRCYCSVDASFSCCTFLFIYVIKMFIYRGIVEMFSFVLHLCIKAVDLVCCAFYILSLTMPFRTYLFNLFHIYDRNFDGFFLISKLASTPSLSQQQLLRIAKSFDTILFKTST